MFEALLANLHKITFGVIGKPAPVADAPVADAQGKAPAPVAVAQGKAPAPVAVAQGKAQAPVAVAQGKAHAPVGDSAEDPVPADVAGTPNPDLKSSTPGVGEDSIQRGGGRRRRRGSRGSRGSRESRSKSKRGGFAQGVATQQAQGVGRAGGHGPRRSKKRNTHKRRK